MGTQSTIKRPAIRAGQYVTIQAKPWEEFILNMSPQRRDRFRDFVWYGYKAVAVQDDQVTIESVPTPRNAPPRPIRETVPAECLAVIEKKRQAEETPAPPPEPYAIGTEVRYLFNYYKITAVYTGADGRPEYDLKQLDRDAVVWSGDRVWHSALQPI